MLKKFLAGFGMLSLLVGPVMAAADATGPAPAAAEAAPAAAPVKVVAKKAPVGHDETGIQKTFAKVSDAWSAGSAAGVASFFTEDGSLINPMGMEGKSPAGVKKVIEAELAGPMKGTQQTFDDFSFTWVMNNFALVDCTATVSGMKKADGMDAEPMKVHVYGAIVNRGKGWKARSIRAFAYLQPPAAGDASAMPAPVDADMPVLKSDKKDKK